MSDKNAASARPRRVLREAVVDDAIDRAVRQIAQVDPRPGLSRRVHSRIVMRARTRPLYLGSYMAVAGALAVLVLAVGLLRPETARETAAPGPTSGQAPVPRENLSEPLTLQPDASTRDRLSATVASTPPAESVPHGRVPSAPSSRADLSAAKTVSDGQSPDQRVAVESQAASIAPKEPGTHAEAIQMPQIVNLFGGALTLVTGANVTGLAESVGAGSVDAEASPLEVVRLPMVPLTIEPLRITPLEAPTKER